MAMMQRERTFYDNESVHARDSPRDGPESDISLSESSDQWMGVASPISRPISLAEQYSPDGSPTPLTPCPERPRPCSPRRPRNYLDGGETPVEDSVPSTRGVRPKSASHLRRRIAPREEDRSSVPPPESTRPLGSRGQPEGGGGGSRNRPKSARHNYGRRQPLCTSIDREDEDLDLEILNLDNSNSRPNVTALVSPVDRDAYTSRSNGADSGALSDRSLLRRRKQQGEATPWDHIPEELGDQTPRQIGERVAARYRRRASSDVTPIMRDFPKQQPQESKDGEKVKPKAALPRKLRPIFNSTGSSPQIDLDSKQSPRCKDYSQRPVITSLPAAMQKTQISVVDNPILRNPQSVQKSRTHRKLQPLTSPLSAADFDDDDLGIEIDGSSSSSADDSDSERPVFDLAAADEDGRLASGHGNNTSTCGPLTDDQSDRRSKNVNKENVRHAVVRTKSHPMDKRRPQNEDQPSKLTAARTKSHPQQYM